MAEELGKIEKPPAADYQKGRRLYFIPMVYRGEEPPDDYLEKFHRYWEQVAAQMADMELKLGRVHRIYHELISEAGETGLKAIEKLNERSGQIVRACLEKGAVMEALEDADRLTEFMDWSRCLLIGLQNEKVLSKVYEAYLEAGRQRSERVAARIDETLGENEIGILLIREIRHMKLPDDINVIYVVPPALDEIKRWLRDREAGAGEEPA